MSYKAGVLAAFLVVSSTGAAADPPFSTELWVDFGYAGSSTARPGDVAEAAGGVPRYEASRESTSSYEYSEDARRHSVAVGATRWLSPVGDDGRTPLALLPWVARVSSASARFSLTGSSTDLLGRFTGLESTYETRYADDGSVRDANLAVEWFLGRSVSVRGAYEHGNERRTAAGTSVESPSGRAQVTTVGTRATTSTGSLGFALRLGEHEVSATGSYGASDLVEDSAGAIVAGTSFARARWDTDALARQLRVATRLLLLDRRLAVDVSGAYAVTTSVTDVTTLSVGPYEDAREISRAVTIGATWYPTRRLGVGGVFSYTTWDTTAGFAVDFVRPTRAETERTLGGSLRWYATERVSASLAAARVENDTAWPAFSTASQRREETTARVTLGAALRF